MGSTLEYWLDGGLGMATGAEIMLDLPMFALGCAGMLASGKALNVLSLGEEAATLGVNPRFWRVIAIGCATLVSSLTVTLAGMIAWIGLVTPHFGRLLVGSDNRVLLPVSGLMGAIVLLGGGRPRAQSVRQHAPDECGHLGHLHPDLHGLAVSTLEGSVSCLSCWESSTSASATAAATS